MTQFTVNHPIAFIGICIGLTLMAFGMVWDLYNIYKGRW